MAGLALSGVRKSFGQTDIIHGVDLDIEDGEFVVFVGPRVAASPPCCA
jgi:ABC-type sugar transport system ATPase subunit